MQQQDGNNYDDDGTIGEYEDEDPILLFQLTRKKRRKIVYDTRGERTPAEEEGIRASEAIDQILVRLSRGLNTSQNRAVINRNTE
jgi:hypothetical protein